jgi:hypothetical protein
MVRRLLAGLLVAVALVAASVAWWGLTLQRTIFDSSRSTQLARALLDSGQLQDALVTAATKAVQGALPPAVRAQVPAAEISAAARSALKDPVVNTSLERALVGTHRYLIGDSASPPALDSAPLDAALRRQLASVRPDLAAVVATIPPLQLKLPDAGVPAVHGLRQQIARLTAWTAAVAVAGIALAFAVARSRRAVLRRVGFWALTTGGLWVALRYVLPAVVRAVVPSSAALVGGLAQAMAEGMAVPGLLLAGGGVSALVASVLPAGIPAADRRARRPRAPRTRERVRPRAPAAMGRPGLEPGPAPEPKARVALEQTVRAREPEPTARLTPVASTAATVPELTEPSPPVQDEGTSVLAPPAGRAQLRLPQRDAPTGGGGPRWVPGHGYVVDEALPEGGRWVDGVGYVLD